MTTQLSDKSTVGSLSPHAPLKALPFLFEVGLPNEAGIFCPRFYLLGSQHNLPKDLVAPDVEKLLAKCDILVKEITPGVFGDASDIDVKELRLHGLFFEKDAPNWTNYLGSEARQYFDDYIKDGIKTAWDVEPYRISPVVINHVISDWELSDSYGVGMDTFIEDQFRSRDKAVFSLENGKIRFDAYNTLFFFNHLQREKSLKDHVLALETTILSWAKNRNQKRHEDKNIEFNEYFSGNIMDNCSFYKTDYLCKRNLAWMYAIERYLEQHPEKTFLFLFGYGHLGGPYGVTTLLTNLGYQIRKML